MRIASKSVAWSIAVTLWVTAVVAGVGAMWAYAETPGKSSTDVVVWPLGASLAFAKETPTLVMIAHPLCPCTRASLAELAKMMVVVHGRVAVYVIVAGSKVTGTPEATATFQRAAAIPGVRAIADRDGLYWRRFGAATSGQVYLYDETGRLRFSGGITSGRGHEGDNQGRKAIQSFINQRRFALASAKVFGCLLDSDQGETR